MSLAVICFRKRIPMVEGDCARRERRPSPLVGEDPKATFPRHRGARFPPRMSELNPRDGALLGNEPHNGGPTLGLRVQPDSAVTGCDSASRLHSAGLRHHEPRASDRTASEVDQMPGGGMSLARRVLAHRRDDDSVP